MTTPPPPMRTFDPFRIDREYAIQVVSAARDRMHTDPAFDREVTDTCDVIMAAVPLLYANEALGTPLLMGVATALHLRDQTAKETP